MTPRTSRISPHAESPHTTLDHLAALTNSRISRGYLRIPCPAHGGTNPNLALWVNGDGIAARCHSAGCSYADIARATLDRYGISINPRRYHDNPAAAATTATSARRAPGPGPNAQDLRPYAINLWRRSVPSPSPMNIPPGSGLPTAIYGGQSCPCQRQSAGSAPNTSAVSSRARAPSSPWQLRQVPG